MVNEKHIADWKVEHYIAYLYLAVAAADSDTTDEEIAMSHRKVKKILGEYYKGSHLNPAIVLDDVLKEIGQHSDSEKTDLINAFNKKFKLEEEAKTDIVSDLTDVIESDDKVQAAEHYMLSFIRVVLSKN